MFSIADMEQVSGKFCVSITVETWKKQHCLNTGYGDEANKKITEIGLVELDSTIEGCYKAADWDEREALRDALEHAGFINDEEFHEWIEGY